MQSVVVVVVGVSASAVACLVGGQEEGTGVGVKR